MKNNVVREKSFAFALAGVEIYKQCTSQREYVLSKQLLRSGTSIGANIEEASAAQSRADFIAKTSIASKEARETIYWLRLLQQSQLVILDFQPILNDAEEIVRLLTSIVKTTTQSPPQ